MLDGLSRGRSALSFKTTHCSPPQARQRHVIRVGSPERHRFLLRSRLRLPYIFLSQERVWRLLLLRMKVVDTVLGALAFWLVGYSVGFTPTDFEFVRAQFEDLETDERHLDAAHSAALWEFHFAFAANAATIVTKPSLGACNWLDIYSGPSPLRVSSTSGYTIHPCIHTSLEARKSYTHIWGLSAATVYIYIYRVPLYELHSK